MDKENFSALQIVPTFSFGLEDVFEDTFVDDTISDADLCQYFDNTSNTNNSASANPEIRSFLNESCANSTVYKNVSAENRFLIFLKSLNPLDGRMIHQIPPTELDLILCKFFMTANKIDKNSIEKLGTVLYQPDSLSSFIHCWQRILSSRGSKIDLKKDKEFATCRKVLAARRKRLTKQGMGNKPCATRPLSNSEVDKLYATGYFGTGSPLALQRNVWWKLTTTFGFRGREESRGLKFGDVKVCFDEETNQNFLEWDKERGSKTRTGESQSSHSHQRSFNPEMYETGGDRCPVQIYHTFVSHRPKDSLTDDSPFFLAIIPPEKISSNTWFYNRPLGKNKLGEFLSKSESILGRSATSRSKIANHSARKTSITTLLDNNVHPLHVIQLSGHKNIDSLNHYHIASKDQRRTMSHILNNQETTDFTVSSPALKSMHTPSRSTESSTTTVSFQRPPLKNLTPTDGNNDQHQCSSVSIPRDRSPLKNTATVAHRTPSNQVNFATKEDCVGSLFNGATIKDNVININITQMFFNQQPRKRYIIYDSDDE